MPAGPLLSRSLKLSDREDSYNHGLHDGVFQRDGREPQTAAGITVASWLKVEQISALPHQIRAFSDVELVESDWTAKRVLRVLRQLQEIFFTLIFLTFLGRDAICI